MDVRGVKAGTLAQEVGADTLATELNVLSGTLNAADFSFISDKMLALTGINLAGCTVEGYRGEPLPYSHLTVSPAATLPAYAFLGMKSLQEVTLPESLTAIGTAAFSGSGITAIELPASVKSVGDYAFLRCTALKSVALPAALQSMGREAFANCSALESVTFGDGTDESALTSLPEGAFEGCVALRSINLADLARCENIGPWALAHMGGLTALSLPEAVRTLEQGALIGNSEVTELSLPGTLESLSDNAMSGMTGLTRIDATELSSVPALGRNVFSSINCPEVMLIASDYPMKNEFMAADQWKEFNIFTEDEATGTEVPVTDSDSSLRVSADGVALSVMAHGGTLTDVAVYNAAGLRVAYQASPADNAASFGIQAWPRGVYLVVTNLGISKISL